MNAICAAGARTTAERVATTPAPLKAKGDEGSRRYIIIIWEIRSGALLATNGGAALPADGAGQKKQHMARPLREMSN